LNYFYGSQVKTYNAKKQQTNTRQTNNITNKHTTNKHTTNNITNTHTTNHTRQTTQITMTSSIGFPFSESTAYTLVIPRVFGDNGTKQGVTPNDVYELLRQQNWGVIQGIDCHVKTDFRTGENYHMIFIRWGNFNPPKEILNTFETYGHVEVDINDYGNFWKIRKFQPKQQTQQVTNLREMKIVPNTQNEPFKPSKVEIQSRHIKDFYDNHDTFIDTGLSKQEFQFAQSEQDRFDDMLMENRIGLINEF